MPPLQCAPKENLAYFVHSPHVLMMGKSTKSQDYNFLLTVSYVWLAVSSSRSKEQPIMPPMRFQGKPDKFVHSLHALTESLNYFCWLMFDLFVILNRMTWFFFFPHKIFSNCRETWYIFCIHLMHSWLGLKSTESLKYTYFCWIINFSHNWPFCYFYFGHGSFFT